MTNTDFVDFVGVAEPREGVLRLTALGNNGFLEFAVQDVRLEGRRVQVRKGAVALAIDEPRDRNMSDRPRPADLRDICPSGITCCIGSVHVCCDDFRVIGSCAGAWGCGKPTFIP